MAGSYTLPQVRVFQEFSETPNDVTQNLNPFVIGPCYQLIRYSDTTERADCSHDTYTGTAKTLAWSSAGYTGTTPDTEWYKVTLANAYVSLGDAQSGTCINRNSSGYGTKIEFALDTDKSLTENGTLGLALDVAVKAGDYLRYTTGSGSSAVTHTTKILSISTGKLSSSEVTGTIVNSAGTTPSGVTLSLTDYTGEKAGTVNLHVIEDTSVTTTKAKVTCSSNIGISQTTAIALTAGTAIDLGNGLKITATTQLAAGDYKIKIVINEPTQRDTVTVADLIYFAQASTSISFTFLRRLDTVDVDSTFLTCDATNGVTILANATVEVDSADLTVVSGEAYLTQRNLNPSNSSGVYSVANDTAITEAGLGPITIENPLAYALHFMLLNCSTASIKYIALKTNDAAGYATALDIASNTNEVYAVTPLTEDADIIDSVVADCERLSTAEEKSWRISFFSKPTDEVKDITPVTVSTTTGLATKEKCTVDSSNVLTCRPAGGSITDESSVCDFTDGSYSAGDTVTVTNVNGDTITRKISEIQSSKTILLDGAVASATSALCSFTITHTLEKAEYVAALAATSSYFRNHRAYNVFPNTLRATDGNYVSGMYAAAAVCALACSVAPQQPITNVEINGFSDLSDVYSTYNRDELNTIAAGGTLILMQDTAGGTVYVRHQISTAYPDGNLNTTELSMTKNLDSISYYFANRFAPYIGRYNITDDLLTELTGVLKDGLAYLETATETNRLLGPQLIADGTEIRSLYRSDEKDKVYADVALNLPAPFNNFDLRLQVI